jgi:hypothetical protein
MSADCGGWTCRDWGVLDFVVRRGEGCPLLFVYRVR